MFPRVADLLPWGLEARQPPLKMSEVEHGPVQKLCDRFQMRRETYRSLVLCSCVEGEVTMAVPRRLYRPRMANWQLQATAGRKEGEHREKRGSGRRWSSVRSLHETKTTDLFSESLRKPRRRR